MVGDPSIEKFEIMSFEKDYSSLITAHNNQFKVQVSINLNLRAFLLLLDCILIYFRVELRWSDMQELHVSRALIQLMQLNILRPLYII